MTSRSWPSDSGPAKALAPTGRRRQARALLHALCALAALAGVAGAAALGGGPIAAQASALPGSRAAGGPGPPAISLADYVRRLDAARTLADADAAHPSAAGMRAVLQTVGLPLEVDVAGRGVRIGTDGFLASLPGNGSEDFLHASDQLGAMEDAARAALAATPPNRGRMAAAIASAYQGINIHPGLLARIRHDLWVIILTLIQRLRGVLKHIPAPSWVVVVAALAVLAAVGVLLVRRFTTLVPEHVAHTPGVRKSKPTDWDRLADEALARGDLTGAVRARYRALLAALATRGVIPQTPSLTAGECRRAVASGLPQAYPVVARATTIFEATLYGHSPVDTADVETLREARESVTVA